MDTIERILDAHAEDDPYEQLASQAYSDVAITEVIRPAAVLPERAAREVLAALADEDVALGGCWTSSPTLWQLHQGADADERGLLGSIQVAYGTPTRHAITIYRATVTVLGSLEGWTVESLCDEALGFGGYSLASCPRAELVAPPRPFRGPLA